LDVPLAWEAADKGPQLPRIIVPGGCGYLHECITQRCSCMLALRGLREIEDIPISNDLVQVMSETCADEKIWIHV